MTFTDTCKDFPAAHHANCRKRNAGVWFRQSVNPADPQFDCPHGRPWIEDDAPVPETIGGLEYERAEKCRDCAASTNEGNGCTLVKPKGCSDPAICFGKWRRIKESVCPKGLW